MHKIGFVVLHYIVMEETVRCIASIKRNVGPYPFEIVVVDNASPNKSGKALEKRFEQDKTIHVICNEENLGFSKGNNVGFRYAKEKLACNYIVVMNNDVEIKSSGFAQDIIEDYEQHGYAVLGPHIETPDGDLGRLNPYHEPEVDRKTMCAIAKKLVFFNTIAYVLSFIKADEVFWKFKSQLRKFVHPPEACASSTEIIKNTGLLGCFWIFSPLYVGKFDGIREITFMYNEEWLLIDMMRQHGLLMMFDPKIRVFHYEKVATQKSGKSGKKRRLKYQREIISAKNIENFILQNERQ